MKNVNLFNSIKPVFFLLLICSCSGNSTEKIKSVSLDSILSNDATLEKLTIGYDFDTAGSPLYMNGELYFTNNNFDSPDQLSRTFRMDQDGNLDTLVTGNGVTTTLRASRKGTIYACQMLGHRVVELNTEGDVLRQVAAPCS